MAQAQHNLSPRFLAYFHFQDDGHRLAIAWLEREHSTGRTMAVHLLRRDEIRGAAHERLPGDHARYLKPLDELGRDRLAQMEDYLRECLQNRGNGQAPRDTYELLGVNKPQMESTGTAPALSQDHDELYRRAAHVLGVPVSELRAKYGHLNPGLQAMNLRNRLRARGQVI